MGKKEREARKEKERKMKEEIARRPKVKMRFPRDMYYNDLNNPIYRKGEIYEIEPQMVERWVKRGGEIVTGAKVEPKRPTPPAPGPSKEPAKGGANKEPVEGSGEKSEDESKPESSEKSDE